MSSNPSEWDNDYRRGYFAGFNQANIDFAPYIEKYNKLEKAIAAAEIFHNKVLEIMRSPEYEVTWAQGWIHGAEYKGETFVKEQEAFLDALTDWKDYHGFDD